MLIQILVFVSNRPEGVNNLISGGLNLILARREGGRNGENEERVVLRE